MKKRSFFLRKGWKFALCVAAAAIAVVICMMVYGAGSVLHFDVTRTGVYTLSPETKAMLADIDEQITIHYLASETASDSRLGELISRYTAASPKIKMDYITAESAAYYTSASLSSYSMIVEGTKYTYVIDYNDIYKAVYGYANGYQTLEDYQFLAEEKIDAAIAYVTDKAMPVAYVLGGHNEKNLEAGVLSAMSEAGYHGMLLYLYEINAIPADCGLLILNVPQADLTENESALITEYLDNGGKMIVVTDPQIVPKERLIAVMEHVGLVYNEGVIMEAERGYLYSADHPYYLIPALTDNEIVASLKGTTALLAAVAHDIKTVGNDKWQASAIAQTSERSYINPTAAQDGNTAYVEGEEMGPFTVAAISQSDNGGMVFWVSTAQCLMDQVSTMVGGGNYALLSKVLGKMNEDYTLSVPAVEPVSIATDPANTAAWQGYVILAVLIVLSVVPLVFGIVKGVKSNKRYIA